jgi:hypothetical protein
VLATEAATFSARLRWGTHGHGTSFDFRFNAAETHRDLKIHAI